MLDLWSIRSLFALLDAALPGPAEAVAELWPIFAVIAIIVLLILVIDFRHRRK